MSGNAAAWAALDEHIARVRSIPGLARQAAPEIAERFKVQLEADIAAGRNPYGEPWAPTKDGRQPLKNAGKALTVQAFGTRIVITLEGVEVLHHIGAARGYRGGSARLGGFRRSIIPWKGLPGAFKTQLRTVLSERWQHLMRGKGRR